MRRNALNSGISVAQKLEPFAYTMTRSSVDIEQTPNGNVPAAQPPPAKKEVKFRSASRFIVKFVSQTTFDTICILIAEVLGTAALLFFGCASTIPWHGAVTPFVPPLAFGLTVAFIIQTFGHISLAILNPAVAICAVVNDIMPISVKIGYQLVERE